MDGSKVKPVALVVEVLFELSVVESMENGKSAQRKKKIASLYSPQQPLQDSEML